MFRRIVSIGVLGAFGVILVGCGDGGGADLVRANGKVLYKGQPLAGATVTFASDKGDLATGITDSNGVFTLSTGGRPGVALGDQKVSIVKMSAAPVVQSTAPPTPDDMRKMQMGSMKTQEPPKSEIPTKYADPKTSGLIAIISSDASKNEFEFPLVD